MRNGIGKRAVVGGDHRCAAANRGGGDTAVDGELEADDLRRQPVHRCAPEHAVLRLDKVEIGGLDDEQRRDLVDEPLQHCFQLELARHLPC